MPDAATALTLQDKLAAAKTASTALATATTEQKHVALLAIAEAVRTRTVSASAMVEASLARIAAIDPAVNAFTDVVADRARGRAAALDRRLADDDGASDALPLAGVLVTAVHLEGRMEGTDLPLMEDVADASDWPVLASGGVSSLDDMRALEHRGLAGAVLGMALYTGALDARRLAEEFGE